MNELDDRLEPTFDRWAFHGSRPDWDDVLQRARPRRGPRPRRRVALLLVPAAAVLLAAPALAVIGALRSNEARPLVVATLTGVGSGRFEASAPHTIFVARRRAFVPLGRLVGAPYRLDWRLDAVADGPIIDARLRRGPGARHGSTIVHLCGPCQAHATERTVVTRAQLTAALNGAEVVVRTAAGELRGTVRPSRR